MATAKRAKRAAKKRIRRRRWNDPELRSQRMWSETFEGLIHHGKSVTEARATADEALAVLQEKFPEEYQ